MLNMQMMCKYPHSCLRLCGYVSNMKRKENILFLYENLDSWLLFCFIGMEEKILESCVPPSWSKGSRRSQKPDPKYRIPNTPGSKIDPGYCDWTLTVKSRKNTQKSTFVRKNLNKKMIYLFRMIQKYECPYDPSKWI